MGGVNANRHSMCFYWSKLEFKTDICCSFPFRVLKHGSVPSVFTLNFQRYRRLDCSDTIRTELDDDITDELTLSEN